MTLVSPRSGRARHVRFLLTVALAPWLLARAPAQELPGRLDPYVLTATRTPVPASTVGSAITVIDASDLARRQVTSLAQALGAAGLPVFASGARGAVASVFLRGANSNQTLFLVDGIRLNDPNTDAAVFLGGSCVAACDNLEVAHGPQSTLYGGEAIGGVVSLRAQAGGGSPTATTALEAGSFGTVSATLAAQGAVGPDAYTVSAQTGRTENQRRNNAFTSSNGALRLDRSVTSAVALGATLRYFHGVYGDPGDRFTNDPDNEDREDNVLGTVFADLKFSDRWTAHATLGGQDRRFVSNNPSPGGATQVTVVKNRRALWDAQTTYAGLPGQRLTTGLTAEANTTRNTGFGNIDRRQELLAFFADDELTLGQAVFLTAGLRRDDFDTFGHATTGRATAAWRPFPVVKVRASYGTGFRSPSFLDLYGQSAFYHGNPNLRPERAHGGDAGIDWQAFHREATFSATWFQTNYSDLIAGTPDFSSEINIQRARTSGAEFRAKWAAGANSVAAAYTYLAAGNLTQGVRLLRRPRHDFSGDAWHDFGGGFSLGVGLAFVADRRDVDAHTFRNVQGEDATTVRLYAAWQATARLALRLRVENLLDEKYEEVNGYPAVSTGVYAGAGLKF